MWKLVAACVDTPLTGKMSYPSNGLPLDLLAGAVSGFFLSILIGKPIRLALCKAGIL